MLVSGRVLFPTCIFFNPIHDAPTSHLGFQPSKKPDQPELHGTHDGSMGQLYIYIYMYWSIHSLKLTCSLKMMMVSNRNPLFQKSISGATLVQGCVDMGYVVLNPIFPPPWNEKKPWNHHGFQVLQLQRWRHLGYQVSEFQRGKLSNKKLGNSIHICWWFRNPANSPVEVGRKSHYLQGFIHPNGGWPWDFWTINSRYPASHHFCDWTYWPGSSREYRWWTAVPKLPTSTCAKSPKASAKRTFGWLLGWITAGWLELAVRCFGGYWWRSMLRNGRHSFKLSIFDIANWKACILWVYQLLN